MTVEPEDNEVSAPAVSECDLAAARESVVERIHFLFRQAADNPPALELEQQIMTYRLVGAPQ